MCLWLPSSAQAEQIDRCVIEVEGVTYLNGPCEFEAGAYGDLTVFGPPTSESPNGYFAYVIGSDKYESYASWNGADQNGNAHAPLGEVKLAGACWLNEHAKVCAYR